MTSVSVGLARARTTFLGAAGISLLLLLTSCSRTGPEQTASAAPAGRGGAGGPVPVSVATVVEKPKAVIARAVGNVEASSTVEVRSQVTGELMAVSFNEGQDVTAGQELFTIDPRPFDAALKQAQAALQKDTAQLKNAQADLERYTNLRRGGLVSQADYDARVATAGALDAAIAADNAAVENAKLQLQYTHIKAAVSGRTGALLVHVGALVRSADATPLVVINQVVPAYVSFTLPASLLDRIHAQQAKAPLQTNASAPGSAAPSPGTVTFIDNAVDQATDTIRLKATFPNKDRRLWPGLFVDVAMKLSVEPHAIVIPDSAIQAGQKGTFVYVVKDDKSVEARPVTVGWLDGGDTVISSGLKAGETVVTDGQLRLAPGARVSIKPPVGSQAPDQK